jgi:hypothetical protein
MDLIYAAVFLAFLALGVAVRMARDAAGRRRRTVALIAYVVLVHLAAGLSQRDAWPFSSHTIAVGRARADATVCLAELVGVDASGGERRLDPYSWMPVYESVLQYWLDLHLARLSDDQRREALAFLLARAEASRERRAAGHGIGPQRWLGPLGAPYWLLLPRQAPSAEPLRGLRVYSACWRPRERAADRARVTRRLLAEHLEARP